MIDLARPSTQDMGGFSGEESEDSVCEEGINPNTRNKEHRLQNEKYDMALEVREDPDNDCTTVDKQRHATACLE